MLILRLSDLQLGDSKGHLESPGSGLFTLRENDLFERLSRRKIRSLFENQKIDDD